MGDVLEPYARKHRHGPDDLRIVLNDIGTPAEKLPGKRLYERL